MAKQQEIDLRVYDLGREQDISRSDVLIAMQETAIAAGLNVWVRESEENGRSMIEISDRSNASYMSVFTCLETNANHLTAVSHVIGKGEQVKAGDLEKWYYKGLGVFDKLMYRADQRQYLRERLKIRDTTGQVAAVAGLAIGKTIKATTKAVRALIRNKDLYEKEMDFYRLAVGIIDFTLGGRDSYGFLDSIRVQADSNNNIAQYVLAGVYANGLSVEKDEAASLYWYEKSAANGNLKSQNIISGEYLYGDKDYSVEQKETGVAYLRNILDSGEDWPVPLLADIYAKGSVKGLPANYEKALDFGRECYEKGYTYPIYLSARILDGTIENATTEVDQYRDLKTAAGLYALFADDDTSPYVEESAYNLAVMSETGKGVPVSEKDALKYYLIAAGHGNLPAQAKLTEMYTFGRGVERDLDKAGKYCDRIVASGNADDYPIVYYSSFKKEEESGNRKESLRLAKQYVASENAEIGPKQELEEYLTDMEQKLASMTDEERREFLGEPRPLAMNSSFLKAAALVAAVVLIAMVIFSVTRNRNSSQMANTTPQSSAKVDTEKRGNNINEDTNRKNNNTNVSPDSVSRVVDDEPKEKTEEQEKALQAYNSLLTGGLFNRDDPHAELSTDGDAYSQNWDPVGCRFCIAYIDDDDIPELLLEGHPASHAGGFGQLYTCRDGKITSIQRLSQVSCIKEIGEEMGYYERTGWMQTFAMWQGYGSLSTVRMGASKEFSLEKDYEPSASYTGVDLVGYHIHRENEFIDCTQSQYDAELQGLGLDRARFIQYEFFDNTEENRERILAVTNPEIQESIDSETSSADIQTLEQLFTGKKLEPFLNQDNPDVSAALSAYANFLSEDYISHYSDAMLETQYWSPDETRFALALINDDDIPELLVVNKRRHGGISNNGDLYTFENGNMLKVNELNNYQEDGLDVYNGYFERSGYFSDAGGFQSHGVTVMEMQYRGPQGIYYHAEFPSELTQITETRYDSKDRHVDETTFVKDIIALVGGVPYTRFLYHDNTSEERDKVFSDISANAVQAPTMLNLPPIETVEQAFKYLDTLFEMNLEHQDDSNFKMLLEEEGSDYYIIRGFDDMPDHIATLFVYKVYRDGTIYDTILNQTVWYGGV